MRTLLSIFFVQVKLHYKKTQLAALRWRLRRAFPPYIRHWRQKCVTFLRCKIRNSSWISREFSVRSSKDDHQEDYTTTAAGFRILAEKLQKNDGVHALIENFSFRKTVIIHQAPFLRPLSWWENYIIGF